MAQFDTVTQILADVGTELGLGTVTASYSSTDANTLLLQRLLVVVGRSLIRRNEFLQCRISTTFATAATAEQTLAADALTLVDGTLWDRTNDRPLLLLTPDKWEQLKAVGSTYSTHPECIRATRVAVNGRCGIEFLSAAPNGTVTIGYQYRSSFWVAVDASSAPTLDAPAATTQVVRIDSHLVSRALRLEWLRSKGFPSEAAQQDYEDVLDSVRSANRVASPVLSIGVSYERPPYFNVPESGYGS
jgi:hypothetical protein